MKGITFYRIRKGIAILTLVVVVLVLYYDANALYEMGKLSERLTYVSIVKEKGDLLNIIGNENVDDFYNKTKEKYMNYIMVSSISTVVVMGAAFMMRREISMLF